jgi:ABC-2 type transport system permease protein
MRDALVDSLHLLMRHERRFLRQSVWLVIALAMPALWMLLNSELFERIVDLPGFGETSYAAFVAPGAAVLLAAGGAIWLGTVMIDDLDRGVIDRLLTTSAARVSLILSQLMHASVVASLQALVTLTMAALLSAPVGGGAVGWIAVVCVSALVATGFAALSHAVGLTVRREETLSAILNFVGLPMTLLSSALIAQSLMPGWMRTLANANPLEWGVRAARELTSANPDWGTATKYLVLVAAFVIASATLATWALERYRRTL